MKKLTLEWVQKAEGDFSSLQRELRARKNPNYDGACFHAQQCVEKYLKACLQERGMLFGRTHDLAVLLRSCLEFAPEWEAFLDDAILLSAYGVAVRYPGEMADRDMALESRSITRKLRAVIRSLLKLND
jgi:HEPN domain-containing protein